MSWWMRSPVPAVLAAAVLVALALSWVQLARSGEVRERLGWLQGEEAQLSYYEVVEVRDPETYVVAKGSNARVVRGPTEGLEGGETLTIRARWSPEEEWFVERWRQPHPWRYYKMGLGIVGLAFVLGAAPFWFTVRGGRLVSRA